MSMLITILILPLVGAFSLLFINSWNRSLIKTVALSVSLINFLLSTLLWLFFDNSAQKFQYLEIDRNTVLQSHLVSLEEKSAISESFAPMLLHSNGESRLSTWFINESESTLNESANYTLNFLLGVDGISIFFIILTTFLIPVCLLVAWTNIEIYVKEYAIAFLVMESLMIAVFSVLDLFLFYIFFESTLIPMFIIIGVWGSRERKIRAAYQFFLYTLLGSLLMLLAVLAIYFQAGTCSLETLYTTSWSDKRSLLLWLAFFASFAVKVPMVPVHIWLPEAHVEAPTAGSVLLAGIMLKLGAYGFLRFSISIFPYASIYFTPLIYTMSCIAIVYTSLTTIRQVDLKKIIAYSSVAHMNFVTLGLFALNAQGIEGSIMLMLSHGIVSPALFLLVGALYDRHKTRLLRYYGGAAQMMPLFAICMLFFTMANISLPGTSSFVGEFLVLTGAFQNNSFATIISATGMVLGAAYALWLCNRCLYCFPKNEAIKAWSDLSRREFWIFFPFIFLVLLMGILPQPFLDTITTSVGNVLQQSIF